MLLVYASRTGNCESIASSTGLETLRIESGSEVVDQPYVLLTYTDGYGDVPYEVDTFLQANSQNLKAVAVSGDTGYGEAYGQAGDKIADMYMVPLLLKIENAGTSEDVQALLDKINTLK